MNTETTTPVTPNRISRAAGIIAVAAWPVGLGLGWLLSQGQDPAGSGMLKAFGFLGAAAVSLVAGIVFLVARWAGSRRG